MDCSVILYKLLPCLSSYLLHSWSHFLFLIWNGVCVAMLNAWSISFFSCWVFSFSFCIDLWTHIYTVLLINICLSVNCLYEQRRMKVEFLLSSYCFLLVPIQVLSENNSHSRPGRLHADHKLTTGIGKMSTHGSRSTHLNIIKSADISCNILNVVGCSLWRNSDILSWFSMSQYNVLPFHF